MDLLGPLVNFFCMRELGQRVRPQTKFDVTHTMYSALKSNIENIICLNQEFQ